MVPCQKFITSSYGLEWRQTSYQNCIARRDLKPFSWQGREQDQKNKFRTEEWIGSLIDTKFVEHRTWLITTSVNNALRTLLPKEMFNPGITSTRVFRITKQHLEIQCRLAATTRFLVQLTTIVNQKWWWYTRVPYKHYTLTTQNFISHRPTA
jgi:hypothetical protein